jgi:hypothetical protein
MTKRRAARRCGTALVVATVVSLATTTLGAATAGALSCASHPRGAPADIVSGNPHLVGGSDFFRRFDIAVIGTITEIVTAAEDDPEWPTTTLTLDVAAIVGDAAAAPRSILVSSPDPGWHSGYPYEVGTTYFIPVQAEGPGGEPNYSFFCDPISEVGAEEVDDLGRVAADAGIAFARPTPPGSSGGLVVVVVVAAAVALIGCVILVRQLTRRRKVVDATAAHPASPAGPYS